MSIYYFMTGLPPVYALEPPPISPENFLTRARNCLDEDVLQDLEKLALILEINLIINDFFANKNNFNFKNYNSYEILNNFHEELYFKKITKFCPIHIRRTFWNMLVKNTRSQFLQEFAREAVNFYEVLAGLLAKKNNLLKNLYDQELAGIFDSTGHMIKNNFDAPNFLLKSRHKFLAQLVNKLNNPDPLVCENFVCEYFFKLCDQIANLDTFSPDQIFSYFIKLTHLTKIYSMNRSAGQKIFNNLVQNLHQEIYHD